MTELTALVTGASSGIGLAIAHTLGSEGYALTIASRRPSNLARAADELRAAGFEVEAVPTDIGSEQSVGELVDHHRQCYGALDLLVNNAGIGIGGYIEQYATKHIDLQLSVNLRSVILMYGHSLDLLHKSVARTGTALVVNVSSITGKNGREWLSVYSAVKAGIVGFTQAMNRELSGQGVHSCVLCPAYVDTSLSDHMKDRLPAEKMIRPVDIAEAVRFLTRLSPNCLVPEIVFQQPGEEY